MNFSSSTIRLDMCFSNAEKTSIDLTCFLVRVFPVRILINRAINSFLPETICKFASYPSQHPGRGNSISIHSTAAPSIDFQFLPSRTSIRPPRFPYNPMRESVIIAVSFSVLFNPHTPYIYSLANSWFRPFKREVCTYGICQDVRGFRCGNTYHTSCLRHSELSSVFHMGDIYAGLLGMPESSRFEIVLK